MQDCGCALDGQVVAKTNRRGLADFPVPTQPNVRIPDIRRSDSSPQNC